MRYYIGSVIIIAIATVLAVLAGSVMISWLGQEDGQGMAALAGAVTFVSVASLLQEMGDWWDRL